MQPIPQTPAGQWQLVLGFFLSPLIELIIHRDWPPAAKTAAAFGVYAATAALTLYWEGRWGTVSWPQALLAIIATAVGGYTGHKALWQPLRETNVRSTAPR